MKLAKMEDGNPEIYGPVIQGEGSTQGLPVIFVRLSNCNLYCSWCDSWYTWYFKGDKRKHDYEEPVDREDYVLTIDNNDVADYIIDLSTKHDTYNIVFTGGEPILQQKDINSVIETLKEKTDKEWYFEVETNGTVKPNDEFIKNITQFNCSPKLESSGIAEKHRERPEVIQRLWDIRDIEDKNVCFKFVVRRQSLQQDVFEIYEWQQKNDIASKAIYLMPEGIEKSQIEETTRMLAELEKNQYNVTTRLHILLYGNQRAI